MNTTLSAAIAARGAAREKHEATAAALGRAREAAAECQREADRLAAEEASWIARHSRKLSDWIAGGSHGNRPQAMADVKAAAAQMTARANLAAAESARGQFEVAEREAREALAAAEAAAREAAREVLFAEVRAEFESFRRQASELVATREWLFAAYLGIGRAALKPAEWMDLDRLLSSPSELLQIGMPDLDMPIRPGQHPVLEAETRVRAERARINALMPTWQARLEELASDGGEPAEPGERQDAA